MITRLHRHRQLARPFARAAAPSKRFGLQWGPCWGLEWGLNPVCNGGGGPVTPLVDFWGLGYGQSNMIGEADAAATGGTSTGGADQGYNAFTADPTIVQRLLFSQAIAASGAQTYTDTGSTGGKAYDTAGRANIGMWLQLSKALKRYGGYSKVGFSNAGPVLGASLRKHLGVVPTAPPASGPTLYQTHIARCIADTALMGRAPSYYVYTQGEADSQDATDAAAYQGNLGTLFAGVRSALGLPNLLIVIIQLNSGMASSTFNSQIRAAQAAYVASDPNSILINVDDIPMAITGIHYDSNGLNDIGERVAFAVLHRLRPTESFNLGSGPVPWVQYASAGSTAQATTSASPRSAPWAQDGDWEYLVTSSYLALGVAHTLTTAAGFTMVGVTAGFSTFGGTNQQQMVVWERPVTAAILAANGGIMPAPVITFGAATLNRSRIFGVRGPNRWTVSPTGGIIFGSNNANNTTCPLLGGVMTAANTLLLLPFQTNAANNGIAAISPGTGMSNAQILYDSLYNPGAGVVELGLGVAQVPSAGIVGNSSFTSKAAGVNLGAWVSVMP